MKVKVISRKEEDFTRRRSTDIYRPPRNLDPVLHPFEKAREYTRALNATKLERLFAKPFVGNLGGHLDGIYSMSKNMQDINQLASGSADGEIRVWDLSRRETAWKVGGHQGFVRGVAFTSSAGHHLVSCGNDRTVKIWDISSRFEDHEASDIEPLNVFHGKTMFSAVDSHAKKSWFATASTKIDVWDPERTEPIHSYTWGSDTINTVKFNKTETSILASSGTDRTLILYDIRQNVPLSKVTMRLKANAICWNPMEAYNFSVASEDYCCYTFDMRKLDMATNIMKDHVGAVLDLDYSPTGAEIVTGSYDKTIRIFNVQQGHSREIYHTKRMQHAFCVKYSMDSKFIFSGSDDGNIRIWKSNASEKIAALSRREKASLDYGNALKQKFGHMPEIRRIAKFRKVPAAIKTNQKQNRIIIDSQKKREENRKNNLPEDRKEANVPERKKVVVQVEK